MSAEGFHVGLHGVLDYLEIIHFHNSRDFSMETPTNITMLMTIVRISNTPLTSKAYLNRYK